MYSFKIRVTPLHLPLRHTFSISRGSKNTAENVFVTVESQGISGYGEAAPNYRYEEYPADVLNDLSGLEEGFEAEISIPDHIQSFMQETGFRTRAAEAALEMALIDWLGKMNALPAHQLLKLDSNITPPTSFTIGIDKKEVMQQKIREAKDAPVFKIKLGSSEDREIIKSIRLVTDKMIRVDANEGWKSLDEAKREIEFLATQNVGLVEQPMPAHMHEEMQQLKEFSPLPLFADESYAGNIDLKELARQFHGINIKLMKSGSVLGSLEQMNAMREIGLKIMIGCMIESSLAISAGALLGYEADFVDLDGHLLLQKDVFEGLQMNDSYQILANKKPGLGIHPGANLISKTTSK